jgi:hypothetical protein
MRNPFKKRVQVTFYMKSGNIIIRSFDEFELTKLSGDSGKSMSYENPDKKFTIDVAEIECCTVVTKFNIFLTKNS